MPTIGLATFAEDPNLYFDDKPLPEAFARYGYETIVGAWDDKSVDWLGCAAVVIRTAWDYHLRVDAFTAWLHHLEAAGVCVINPPQLIQWNANKIYLRDIVRSGCRMLDTVFVEQGDTQSLVDIMNQQRWEKAVIKPLIGANAMDTWLVEKSSAENHQVKFNDVVQATGAMVQRFAPEIFEGEWSMVFFNGIFSHATLKFPAKGTIFVHEDKGGVTRLEEPSVKLVTQAGKILHTAKMLSGILPIYARVDGLVCDGDFLLMEIECIEPELFFTKAEPYAAERFVSAVIGAIR